MAFGGALLEGGTLTAVVALLTGLALVGLIVLGVIALRQTLRYRQGPDARRWQHTFGNRSGVLVFGHRGFGKDRVPAENTAAAFDAALDAGADGFEFDVILSGDDVPIVAHGPTAEAAGLPDVLIEKQTLAQLQELNFAAAVGGPPGRLLTLAELLERYSGRTILNIELKLWRILDGTLEREVAVLLRPYLMRGDRIFCTSFNPFSLLRIRRLLPQLCLGMLWRDDLHWFAANRSLFWLVRPDFLQHFEGRIDGELLEYAHRHGYRLHAWTINDRARFEELRAAGIHVLYSDNVSAAVAWRAEPTAGHGAG